MARRSLARGLAGALLAIAGAAPLTAQQSPIAVPPGAPFSVRHFDTSNGLPQNSVTALDQTRDGAMWIGTFGGLCRFDGTVWQVFDAVATPALDDSRVLAMRAAADGTLWFATEAGTVLRWHAGDLDRVAEFPRPGDAQGKLVRAIQPTSDGRLLYGNSVDLLVRERDGRTHPYYAQPSGRVNDVVEPVPGTLWLCSDRGLFELGDGAPRRLLEGQVRTALVTPSGRRIVATTTGLLAASGDDFTPLLTWPRPLTESDSCEIVAAADDSLWLGVATQLLHWHDEGDPRNVAFRCQTAIESLAIDRTGGIWCGFRGAGVSRIEPTELRLLALPVANARPPKVVLGDGNGGFYVGGDDGLFHASADGSVAAIPLPHAAAVGALFRDRDGTLWLGIDRAVVARRGDGWSTFRIEQVEDPGQVVSIHRARDGTLWAGAQRGIFLLDTTAEPRLVPATAAPELASDDIRVLTTTADGALWAAGTRGVLRLATDGTSRRWWRYGVELPKADVRGVLTSPGGRLWLATYGNGFVGLGDGPELATVTETQGLRDNFVCTGAALGESWIVGGNRGAFAIDPQALDDLADGRLARLPCRPLATPHGVIGEANGGCQPAAAAEGDRFALCTLGGVLVTSRAELSAPPPTPPVAIDLQLTGDQRRVGDEPTTLQCLADRTLVARLTAPWFDSPSPLHYRWRLLPGGTWSEPSPQQALTLTLPGPGEFLLEVEAFSVAGAASSQTQLAVRVLPHVWERAPFQLAALGLLALGAFLAFRLGSVQQLRRALALQRLVDERTAELREAQDHLEQRVADRTAELQQALRQIEADHEQRVRLERELQQAQRIESLGHLAGGIAHDFNNLLTVVVGHTAMLQMQLRDHPEAADSLARIREASEQGRGMTQHLLAVASQQAVTTTVLDLGAQLREQQNVLRDLLGSQVTLQLDLPTEPLYVQAAPNQIEQIVMNLCVNARDALPHGGTVRIAAQLARSGEHAPQPDRIELRISDDGVGMTEAVRQRAFEPFFTTKRGHRGVGLGLATVYGVTKQLGGTATIDSAPDAGTRFLFVFPRAKPPVLVPRPTPTAAPGPAALRVLLVEDEPTVRRVLHRLLDLQGCRVIAEAVDGEHALRQLAEFGAAIDVVLSDLQMPGPQGLELVGRLRLQRPDLPIVFLSGFATASHSLAEFATHGIELLGKPPDPEDLLRALQRAVVRAGNPVVDGSLP